MFKYINISKLLLIFFILFSYEITFASDSQQSDKGIAKLAKNVTSNFEAIGRLIVAGAYLAGFMFVFSGAVKFKAHRDNPSQTPLSAPLVLIGVGAALFYLPSLVQTSGDTLFGDSASAGGFDGGGLSDLNSK